MKMGIPNLSNFQNNPKNLDPSYNNNNNNNNNRLYFQRVNTFSYKS